jgi:hypothetical protein
VAEFYRTKYVCCVCGKVHETEAEAYRCCDRVIVQFSCERCGKTHETQGEARECCKIGGGIFKY